MFDYRRVVCFMIKLSILRGLMRFFQAYLRQPLLTGNMTDKSLFLGYRNQKHGFQLHVQYIIPQKITHYPGNRPQTLCS